MKRVYTCLLAILVIITGTSWGFYAHYRINHLAVYILPPAMSSFYKANISYITEQAVAPDKRRYVDSAEIPRHYFNADHYGKDPFHTVPQKWEDAAQKYSTDTLIKYGTLPWVIQENYYKLVKAFQQHDTTAILHTSAYLGHYVADACVPLHTISNYDGQLTHQNGIHALWESRLPELFGHTYRYYTGKARYIDNPLWQAFIICRGSYKCTDSVLRFERRLNATYRSGPKMELVKRGNRKILQYTYGYSMAYQKALNNMVERRLRMAILWVGSFWYSAWVDAGQPNLNQLIAQPLTTGQLEQLNSEQAAFKAGKPLPESK
ncbi:zinc dependent phospholipase C family protein [Mucilaginibacter sp.]